MWNIICVLVNKILIISILEEIFNFIDSRKKSWKIIDFFKIKTIKTSANDLKIWYLNVFFFLIINYSFVVDKLNNNSNIKKKIM